MKIIIHPTYFPNIFSFKTIINSTNILFEVNDHYVKQTLRNRTSIHAANGKLNLSVPVKFSSTKKEKYKDIKICYDSNWQKIHLKSIESAYKNSPFYDFFEDYFINFYNKKEKFLVDLNFSSIRLIFEILEKELNCNFTNEYLEKYVDLTDYRSLLTNKNFNEKVDFKNYTQVFQEKNGFIENLSSIDLIFNKGLDFEDFIKF
ncbi:MAG: WbqC family protein [Flavobacteriaceae bacterium]|tara:strand:+ start:284 stop:892 length:609 start_codon:yes stop_codon:yes gene_type:complete